MNDCPRIRSTAQRQILATTLLIIGLGLIGVFGLQAQGTGFANSIASARPIVDQFAATGHAVHPYSAYSRSR